MPRVVELTRARALRVLLLGLCVSAIAGYVSAGEVPDTSHKRHADTERGYSILYPSSWEPVVSAPEAGGLLQAFEVPERGRLVFQVHHLPGFDGVPLADVAERARDSFSHIDKLYCDFDSKIATSFGENEAYEVPCDGARTGSYFLAFVRVADECYSVFTILEPGIEDTVLSMVASMRPASDSAGEAPPRSE